MSSNGSLHSANARGRPEGLKLRPMHEDNADPMNDVEEFGAATDDSERQGLIQELVSPPQPQDGPSAEEAPFETFAEALANDT